MTTLVSRAVEGLEGATTRDAQRARNLFALGLVSWLYDRPTEVTERWIEGKFADKPTVRDVNLAAFRAGLNFGETSELIDVRYEVRPATDVPPGVYRNVNGTTTTALGLLAASVRSGLPLVLSAYPITPASELLHDLSTRQSAGVRTIQAEDEIAAAGMALGAAFGGALGVTATSGPGLDLKTETIGLAVALELPMVIVDVQRAGPSTGMPTKTEQSDLLAALYGRHGESPVPIVAASTPGAVLRRRLRGGAHRRALPHAGHPAHRPLPGQRLGAVADPAGGVAARHRSRLRAGAEQRRRLHALRAQRRRRAPVGDPRHARPDAPHRRPGEAGRHRRDQLRPRQPRAHDRAAGGQGGRHRGPRRRGRPRGRRRAARARLGLERGRAARRRAPRAHRAGARSPAPTCTTSTRCRPTSARCCAPTRACCCPR